MLQLLWTNPRDRFYKSHYSYQISAKMKHQWQTMGPRFSRKCARYLLRQNDIRLNLSSSENNETNAYRVNFCQQLQSHFDWGKREEERIKALEGDSEIVLQTKVHRNNSEKNCNTTATGSTNSCCNVLSIMEDGKVLRQNFFSSSTRTSGSADIN